MRTNMNLMARLSKEPKKLFGHVFTKGDVILYWDYSSKSEKRGIYINHTSFSTWHNGIEYLNNRHAITIIAEDGTEHCTQHTKPVDPNQRRA